MDYIEKNLIFAAQKITNKNYTKMYAIVEIAGQQFKVEKDRRVYVQRLKAEEGAQVTFDRVMLVDNDGDVKVGTPTVSGANVTATVLQHLKGDKVLVFKKKRLSETERSPSVPDLHQNRWYHPVKFSVND